MPRILIADDEPELRHILAEMCTALGSDTVTARDGVEAIEALGRQSFDAVLLDITMPRLDGMGVLQQLRDQPPAHPPAIIVVTAANDHKSRMAATQLGAIDFVDKPFRVPALQQRLERVLAIVDLERRLRDAEHTLDTMRRVDPVTGCGAFAELYQAIEADFYVARDGGAPLACVLVSDERYDPTLASRGRAAGDSRLIALLSQLERYLAPRSRIFRVDAAEFVVLLPGTAADVARRRAQELCQRLEGAVQPADLAVAIAGYPHPEISQASTLYRAANISLAQARSHRRIVMFEGFDLGLGWCGSRRVFHGRSVRFESRGSAYERRDASTMAL